MVLVLASLPLSGRLVSCPWYWEYHSVEFSVPASGQNLELSVPTRLVLTFCIEKSSICIRMLHKCALCCSYRVRSVSAFNFVNFLNFFNSQEYFAEMDFHGFGLYRFESVVLSDKKKATTSKQESPECSLNKGNPGD